MTTKKKFAIGYLALTLLGTQALWFLPEARMLAAGVAIIFFLASIGIAVGALSESE